MPTPTKYTYAASQTANNKVNVTTLSEEVAASSIVTALDHIDFGVAGPGIVDIWFKDTLSTADQVTLTAVVQAHQGNPPPSGQKDTHGNPVVAPYAFGVSNEQTKFKGYLYAMSPNAVNIYDELITKQVFIQGGAFETQNAYEGDNADFSIVDKDDVLGLFALYGLTVGVDVLEVRRYVETEFMFAGANKEDLRVEAAGQVFAGLYFRTKYVSVAPPGSPDTKVKVRYLYYEV
jgi:hypothetical protein